MIADNYKSWHSRNIEVESMIKKKQKQVEQLKLEIFTLNFALEYWKQHPFKECE